MPLAKDFVQCLLEPNPKKRPSATQALKHPWLVKHCGEPPADLQRIDDDDDDDDDDRLLPRWGAISRLGARISSDTDAAGIPDSERSSTTSSGNNTGSHRSGIFGSLKLFRKAKSSFQ